MGNGIYGLTWPRGACSVVIEWRDRESSVILRLKSILLEDKTPQVPETQKATCPPLLSVGSVSHFV